ncbi:hypothetical protein VTJ04DRAFT_8206 [Mycothermus thermophilus]|uniref:uncharacterized protein n=1 Tax=Humicola insolens TaxID=85995 RepID=UPI0037433D5A
MSSQLRLRRLAQQPVRTSPENDHQFPPMLLRRGDEGGNWKWIKSTRPDSGESGRRFRDGRKKKESRGLEVVEIEQCGNREITTIGRDLLASSKVVVENRSRLPGAVVEDGATRTSSPFESSGGELRLPQMPKSRRSCREILWSRKFRRGRRPTGDLLFCALIQRLFSLAVSRVDVRPDELAGNATSGAGGLVAILVAPCLS